MAQSQLFQRILEVDPQAILPYVIDHIGQTQRAVIAGTTKLITEGQTDHSIRQGNPHHMACAIELSLRSYVFSARATQPTCPRQTALTELHAMLDRYLAPHPDDHNIAAVTAGPHRP